MGKTTKKCCGCVPLNIGVILVGIISLVLDVGRIVAILVFLPSLKSQRFEWDPDDVLQIGVLGIIALFGFVDLLLIYGTVTKQSNYLVPWMMAMWFTWVVMLGGFIFQLVNPLGTTSQTLISLGAFVFYAGLTVGAYVIVYELYMELMHGSKLTRLLEKEQKINTP